MLLLPDCRGKPSDLQAHLRLVTVSSFILFFRQTILRMILFRPSELCWVGTMLTFMNRPSLIFFQSFAEK